MAKNKSQESNTTDCPNCLGLKEVFDGTSAKECDFCKGEGKVDEHKYDYFIGGIEEEFSYS